MKKTVLGVFMLATLAVSYAQVGINITEPVGIFHMDAKGNTVGNSNLSDDVIIASDGKNGVNVSLGALPIIGASVSLNSKTKGFLPNRVQLASNIDVTTVSAPVEGMLVYNMAAAGIYPNNVIPGYYIYRNSEWQRLRTNSYSGLSSTKFLVSSVTTRSTNDVNSLTAPILDFGAIQIFEDGAYAISFNVSATSSTGALANNITRGVAYIYILKKSVGQTSFSHYKSIEFNPALFPNGASFTLSVIASMELKSQDELMFRTSHYSTYPSLTYKPGSNSTFLTYWKL